MKALLRVAVVWNVPVACNRATADFIISFPPIGQRYEHRQPEYRARTGRQPAPATHGGQGKAA